MSSKRIEIFKESSNSLKISFKSYAFSKKIPVAIAALAQLPVRPRVRGLTHTRTSILFEKKNQTKGPPKKN
jgi:hypothetical protein